MCSRKVHRRQPDAAPLLRPLLGPRLRSFITTRTSLPGILLALTLAATGCKSNPFIDADTHHRAKSAAAADQPHRPRSQAMAALPQLHTTLTGAPLAIDPWWNHRYDEGPSVAAGYVSPQRQRVLTYTFDRQSQSYGHVHDRYQRTTRRVTVQRGVQ